MRFCWDKVSKGFIVMPSRVSSFATLSVAFLIVFFALPAFAGNWGENWGEMTWGEVIAAVPLTGQVGFLFLVFGLLGVALWMFRARAAVGVVLLALMVGGANFAEAQVSVPNTFTDGTPALAAEVNENFQTLAAAVNSSECATSADVVCNTSCPAAPACDTLGSYNQGFAAGGNGVDIASDNAAVCTTAGGTYDAGADSCSVDITTDNAAIAAAAGNAACTQAGGTWEAGTSTCTPGPAASSYNCFVGGFCAQAAINYPPGSWGYSNVYEGHTQGTEPALGAGCNTPPELPSGMTVRTSLCSPPTFLTRG